MKIFVSTLCICLELVVAGCSHTPTAPESLVDPPSAVFTACGQVLIDGAPGDIAQAAQTKQTAIRDSSGITLDASCSKGTGLTYSASWGDGTAASSQSNSYFSVPHVYAANGNYTVTLTARSPSGAAASWTGVVKVVDFSGRWTNTRFNAVTNRNETRYLDLTQGANRAVAGVYTAPDGNSTSLTGSINGLRGLNIHSAGSAVVVYADDSGGEQLSSDGAAIRLEILIGNSNILFLTFTRS